MKRFWLVLLSLGLIVAFSTSAMALDVKFSGEYYAAGLYMDKTALTKTPSANPSTAFYFQRLRVGTQFVVSPGLSLIARADVMERAWGAARSAPVGGATNLQSIRTGTSFMGTAANVYISAGTQAENENIAFDLLYVSYASPIGLFNVGYQVDGAWGTVFSDSSIPVGKIAYALPVGNLAFVLQMGKYPDGERSAGMVGGLANAADRDSSFYTAAVRYAWKNGDAGFLFKYNRDATNRFITLFGVDGFNQTAYIFVPYVKAKFGALSVQGEFTYVTGKVKWDSSPAPLGQKDRDIKAYNGYLDLLGDFGMFYVGLTGAHVSGEDQGTDDALEGITTGGTDWNPCLIMFNSDRQQWLGGINGYGGTTMYGGMTNAWFGQIRAGVRPTDKIDVMLSYSYAKADKSLGVGFDKREYGSEIDLTATYKITNNLSYMLGAGYWMVGDFYKGNVAANNDLQDQMMLINKLTLTF